MPRKFPMPNRDESKPTECAGKNPEFELKSVVATDDGREILIVGYLINEGLYVVSQKDGQGPLPRISPARLRSKATRFNSRRYINSRDTRGMALPSRSELFFLARVT